MKRNVATRSLSKRWSGNKIERNVISKIYLEVALSFAEELGSAFESPWKTHLVGRPEPRYPITIPSIYAQSPLSDTGEERVMGRFPSIGPTSDKLQTETLNITGTQIQKMLPNVKKEKKTKSSLSKKEKVLTLVGRKYDKHVEAIAPETASCLTIMYWRVRRVVAVRGGVHEADTCVSPWLSIPSKDLEEDYTGKEEEEEETRGHREHNKVEQEAEDEEVMKEEDARREFAEFWLVGLHLHELCMIGLSEQAFTRELANEFVCNWTLIKISIKFYGNIIFNQVCCYSPISVEVNGLKQRSYRGNCPRNTDSRLYPVAFPCDGMENRSQSIGGGKREICQENKSGNKSIPRRVIAISKQCKCNNEFTFKRLELIEYRSKFSVETNGAPLYSILYLLLGHFQTIFGADNHRPTNRFRRFVLAGEHMTMAKCVTQGATSLGELLHVPRVAEEMKPARVRRPVEPLVNGLELTLEQKKIPLIIFGDAKRNIRQGWKSRIPQRRLRVYTDSGIRIRQLSRSKTSKAKRSRAAADAEEQESKKEEEEEKTKRGRCNGASANITVERIVKGACNLKRQFADTVVINYYTTRIAKIGRLLLEVKIEKMYSARIELMKINAKKFTVDNSFSPHPGDQIVPLWNPTSEITDQDTIFETWRTQTADRFYELAVSTAIPPTMRYREFPHFRNERKEQTDAQDRTRLALGSLQKEIVDPWESKERTNGRKEGHSERRGLKEPKTEQSEQQQQQQQQQEEANDRGETRQKNSGEVRCSKEQRQKRGLHRSRWTKRIKGGAGGGPGEKDQDWKPVERREK
ncbi:hypothetical protein WN51_05711 [Melipona quadrifasciata]|uniref:Uncharacterized protein n=1 Tax=Melipona quadrifasciata TaxID=166423 RepID=A0A0M9A5U0_9HYME|nr:hypothetical protein WN51_05711 [Melipona quadrifasciata]